MCHYSRDVATIKAHGLQSEAGLLDVIEFVFATIQQPLSMVPQIRADVLANGLDSAFLFGSKRKGLRYAQENAGQLLNDLNAVIDEHGTDSVKACTEAVDILFQVTGLGVVKAGFVAQCLGFNVGCLDSHNIVRMGLKVTDVSIRKTLKRETQRRKIKEYIELCQHMGTANLWNDWCSHVAGNIGNKSLTTGDEVSAFHVECIIQNVVTEAPNGFAI